MNVFKIVFGCLLVFVLVIGSVVVAQEVDPPRNDEVINLDASDPDDSLEVGHPPEAADDVLDEALGESYMMIMDDEGNITYIPVPSPPLRSVAPSPDAIPLVPEMRGPADTMPSAERPESLPENDTDEAGRIVEPVTGLIPIATAAVPVMESQPAVAHGGNRYMVAYVRDGTIYAAVLNNSGTVLTTHIIANSATCILPRVAYHAPSGLFLVTYQRWNGATYDIWFTAVSPGLGKVGIGKGWNLGVNMTYPDVACNQAHNSCLVAYQHDTNSIRGFYVTLENLDGADWGSNTYDLSNTSGTNPFIAWGKNSGRYLLIYTWTSAGVKYPVYTHIYDIDHSVDPWAHPAHYLINFAGWANDKYPTGVAYDPCTEKFVVLFDHVLLEVPVLVVDVWAAAIHKTDPAAYWHNHVAYRFAEERGGGISFVTDDNLPAACGPMDKLVYTYTYIHRRIYASDLRGNNSITAPVYIRDEEGKHLIVRSVPLDMLLIGRPSISSGSARAEMLVAFTVQTSGPMNFDIYGRLIRTPVKYYFPLTMR